MFGGQGKFIILNISPPPVETLHCNVSTLVDITIINIIFKITKKPRQQNITGGVR